MGGQLFLKLLILHSQTQIEKNPFKRCGARLVVADYETLVIVTTLGVLGFQRLMGWRLILTGQPEYVARNLPAL